MWSLLLILSLELVVLMLTNICVDVQEIEILKSLSFDRSIVQFYGTCPWHGQTMLVLELMEVCANFISFSIRYTLALCCMMLHIIDCLCCLDL